MRHLGFPAMGTWFDLYIDTPPSRSVHVALDACRRETDRLENVFSRFRPESEVSRLNREHGGVVSTDMWRVLSRAARMTKVTAGWFNPVVGRAVCGAGYDRTFDDVTDVASITAVEAGTVILHERNRSVRIQGGDLDLGGIAKGDAADRLCDLLAQLGPCLVSAGGDVVARGCHRDGPWPIGIETGNGEVVFHLSEGALVTSGIDRRRWTTGDGMAHHVIDPFQGRPSDTDLLRVSAAAATGAEADALATAMLAAGTAHLSDLANRPGVGALVAHRDGRIERMGVLA